MKFRGTVFVLVIAAALGGYVYWHEIRGGNQRQQRRIAAQKLLGIDRSQIEAIRITHSETLFELAKRGDAWFLLQPVPTACDPVMISSFLDTLVEARREDDVGRGDLARYGLDAPAARVEIVVGGKTRLLLLGRINPLQTMVYLQLDDSKDVLLSTSSLLTYALNSSFGWRDKRMIDVAPEVVQKISARTILQGEFALLRDEQNVWRVAGDVPWRADPVRAQSLLLRTAQLKAVGVAAENKADLARFGLGNRQFSIQVGGAGGSVLGDLVFGWADGSGSYFGIVPDKPEVFRVDGALVDLVVAMATDPRDHKALPPYDPEKVTRIEARTPEDEFVLERRSAVRWVVRSSSRVDSTFALSLGSISNLLTDLVTLDLQEYPSVQPAASDFEPPVISVRLFEGGRPVSGIQIGRRDRQGVFTYARGWDEPAAFLLSPGALLKLPIDLDRFKAEGEEVPVSAERG